MKLYHGTNVDFRQIDIAKSKAFKDFGQGFYLTDIRKQAEDWARKKSELLGGNPVLQEYDFDEAVMASKELNVLVFETPTAGSGFVNSGMVPCNGDGYRRKCHSYWCFGECSRCCYGSKGRIYHQMGQIL